MIGKKKISVSVHTDFQKLVCTENESVNEISAHQFLKISVSIHTDFQKLAYTEENQCTLGKKQCTLKINQSTGNQCTPVFENQCICSH